MKKCEERSWLEEQEKKDDSLKPVTTTLLKILVFSFVLSSGSSFIWATSTPKKYTLQDLIALGLKNNPMIQEAKYELAGFKAQKEEAVAANWWPQGEILAILAPAPPARGNAVTSNTKYPDAFFMFKDYGIMTRFEMQLVWPLYTFGKLSLYNEAAAQGVQLGQAKLKMAKSQFKQLIQKAYFGIQYAQSILFLLEDAQDYLKDAKKKAKNKTDQLKLVYFSAEFEARKVQAQEGKRIAWVSLLKLIGLPSQSVLELDEEELRYQEEALKTYSEYEEIAKQKRPENKLLEHAEKAQGKVLSATRRGLFPDFFVGGFLRHGFSSAADDQLSPFARDDYNFFEGGIFLGVKFSLDIPLKVMRIKKKEAQFRAFQSKRKLAHLGMSIELNKAYGEVVSLKKIVFFRQKGKKAAEQWITRVMMSYSSGLSELKDVTEALTTSGQSSFQFLEAVYKWKLALVELERVTGISILSSAKSK